MSYIRSMIPIIWNPDKNEQLQRERGVSFEDVLVSIELGRVLDVIVHPNPNRYPNQFVLIVNINHYAYAVPFVVTGETIFFKTVFPSRKWTKYYLSGGEEHE